MTLVEVAEVLVRELDGFDPGPPVAYAYNPLVYAAAPHRSYLRRYGDGRPQALLLGMNPGPWGMAQTGVPFGAVGLVRDWLGIDGAVGQPPRQHPKRPVEGFACRREEVSGSRLWGWARRTFGTPERFFARLFVHNYCPLLFLDRQGRNVTPDKLRAARRRALTEPCDRALAGAVRALGVGLVVGVGGFAEARARHALEGLDVRVGGILHPSPASPRANRGWAETAERQLRQLGVELP